jgi:hypothetical protein
MSKPSFGGASISVKNEKILARQLSRQGTPRSSEVAIALKQQAKGAFFAGKNSAHISSHILAGELQLFRVLQSNLEGLDQGCARLLARTPEAFVTSIKGIGITLISSICAERGSLAQVTRVDRLNAYAGIVPKVKQTGGPESEAKIRGRRRSFNRVLKDYTLQAGKHLYLHGPEELMHDAVHRKLGGRVVDAAMARRFFRIARALCQKHYIYLPSGLRGQDTSPAARAQYILDSWPDLLISMDDGTQPNSVMASNSQSLRNTYRPHESFRRECRFKVLKIRSKLSGLAEPALRSSTRFFEHFILIL